MSTAVLAVASEEEAKTRLLSAKEIGPSPAKPSLHAREKTVRSSNGDGESNARRKKCLQRRSLEDAYAEEPAGVSYGLPTGRCERTGTVRALRSAPLAGSLCGLAGAAGEDAVGPILGAAEGVVVRAARTDVEDGLRKESPPGPQGVRGAKSGCICDSVHGCVAGRSSLYFRKFAGKLGHVMRHATGPRSKERREMASYTQQQEKSTVDGVGLKNGLPFPSSVTLQPEYLIRNTPGRAEGDPFPLLLHHFLPHRYLPDLPLSQCVARLSTHESLPGSCNRLSCL